MKAFALVLALLCVTSAQAQVVPANVAVPYYTPPAFVQGVYKYWYFPRAEAFAREAATLGPAIDGFCKGATPLQPARAQWQATAAAWDRLASVAVGPLLQRRSIRRIDFTPTRPELIERAIGAQPADVQALEAIGTPAKGLPALEWLLWTQPVAAGTPACNYAVLLAAEVDAEAKALLVAFVELAARDWSKDEAAAVAAMGEVLNQWVGGIERLRWANIGKPVRSSGGKAPAFPRAASGSTRQSWTAQWEGLAALGAAAGNAVPQPGAALVPLETYLRGRGLNTLAGKLAGAVGQAGRHVGALAPADRGKAQAAERALGNLKRLAEAEVAPALEVNIGFSDADGD